MTSMEVSELEEFGGFSNNQIFPSSYLSYLFKVQNQETSTSMLGSNKRCSKKTRYFSKAVKGEDADKKVVPVDNEDEVLDKMLHELLYDGAFKEALFKDILCYKFWKECPSPKPDQLTVLAKLLSMSLEGIKEMMLENKTDLLSLLPSTDHILIPTTEFDSIDKKTIKKTMIEILNNYPKDVVSFNKMIKGKGRHARENEGDPGLMKRDIEILKELILRNEEYLSRYSQGLTIPIHIWLEGLLLFLTKTDLRILCTSEGIRPPKVKKIRENLLEGTLPTELIKCLVHHNLNCPRYMHLNSDTLTTWAMCLGEKKQPDIKIKEEVEEESTSVGLSTKLQHSTTVSHHVSDDTKNSKKQVQVNILPGSEDDKHAIPKQISPAIQPKLEKEEKGSCDSRDYISKAKEKQGGVEEDDETITEDSEIEFNINPITPLLDLKLSSTQGGLPSATDSDCSAVPLEPNMDSKKVILRDDFTLDNKDRNEDTDSSDETIVEEGKNTDTEQKTKCHEDKETRVLMKREPEDTESAIPVSAPSEEDNTGDNKSEERDESLGRGDKVEGAPKKRRSENDLVNDEGSDVKENVTITTKVKRKKRKLTKKQRRLKNFASKPTEEFEERKDPEVESGKNKGSLINLQWKSCPMEEIWTEGVLVPVTAYGAMVPELCYLCGSAGMAPMIYCRSCAEPFHKYCLDMELTDVVTKKWRCDRCITCKVCSSSSQKMLLKCCECYETFHSTCLPGNVNTKPNKNGVWKCHECLICAKCGTKDGKDVQWLYDFSICKPCGKLYNKGNYCPICEKVYRDEDYDTPMVSCTSCEHWVHIECENISELEYEAMSHLPEERVLYMCSRCTRESVWRSDMIKCIQENLAHCVKVLDCAADLTGKIRLHHYNTVKSIRRFEQDVLQYVAHDTRLVAALRNVLTECFPWYYKVKSSLFAVKTPVKSATKKEINSSFFVVSTNKVPQTYQSSKFVERDTRKCVLCSQQGDLPEETTGRLLLCGLDSWVHVNCALWSSEVYEDGDGKLMNVEVARNRGISLRCDHCMIYNATIGCCHKTCPRSFHFNCALKSGALLMNDQRLFCKKHRTKYDEMDTDQKETNFIVDRRVFIDPSKISATKRYSRPVESSTFYPHLGASRILNLGNVMNISDHPDTLIPINFTVERIYWSLRNPEYRCIYRCTVVHMKPKDPDVFFSNLSSELCKTEQPFSDWVEKLAGRKDSDGGITFKLDVVVHKPNLKAYQYGYELVNKTTVSTPVKPKAKNKVRRATDAPVIHVDGIKVKTSRKSRIKQCRENIPEGIGTITTYSPSKAKLKEQRNNTPTKSAEYEKAKKAVMEVQKKRLELERLLRKTKYVRFDHPYGAIHSSVKTPRGVLDYEKHIAPLRVRPGYYIDCIVANESIKCLLQRVGGADSKRCCGIPYKDPAVVYMVDDGLGNRSVKMTPPGGVKKAPYQINTAPVLPAEARKADKERKLKNAYYTKKRKQTASAMSVHKTHVKHLQHTNSRITSVGSMYNNHQFRTRIVQHITDNHNSNMYIVHKGSDASDKADKAPKERSRDVIFTEKLIRSMGASQRKKLMPKNTEVDAARSSSPVKLDATKSRSPVKLDAAKISSPVKVDDKQIRLEQEKWRQEMMEREKRQHQLEREQRINREKQRQLQLQLQLQQQQDRDSKTTTSGVTCTYRKDMKMEKLDSLKRMTSDWEERSKRVLEEDRWHLSHKSFNHPLERQRLMYGRKDIYLFDKKSEKLLQARKRIEESSPKCDGHFKIVDYSKENEKSIFNKFRDDPIARSMHLRKYREHQRKYADSEPKTLKSTMSELLELNSHSERSYFHSSTWKKEKPRDYGCFNRPIMINDTDEEKQRRYVRRDEPASKSYVRRDEPASKSYVRRDEPASNRRTNPEHEAPLSKFIASGTPHKLIPLQCNTAVSAPAATPSIRSSHEQSVNPEKMCFILTDDQGNTQRFVAVNEHADLRNIVAKDQHEMRMMSYNARTTNLRAKHLITPQPPLNLVIPDDVERQSVQPMDASPTLLKPSTIEVLATPSCETTSTSPPPREVRTITAPRLPAAAPHLPIQMPLPHTDAPHLPAAVPHMPHTDAPNLPAVDPHLPHTPTTHLPSADPHMPHTDVPHLQAAAPNLPTGTVPHLPAAGPYLATAVPHLPVAVPHLQAAVPHLSVAFPNLPAAAIHLPPDSTSAQTYVTLPIQLSLDGNNQVLRYEPLPTKPHPQQVLRYEPLPTKPHPQQVHPVIALRKFNLDSIKPNVMKPARPVSPETKQRLKDFVREKDVKRVLEFSDNIFGKRSDVRDEAGKSCKVSPLVSSSGHRITENHKMKAENHTKNQQTCIQAFSSNPASSTDQNDSVIRKNDIIPVNTPQTRNMENILENNNLVTKISETSKSPISTVAKLPEGPYGTVILNEANLLVAPECNTSVKISESTDSTNVKQVCISIKMAEGEPLPEPDKGSSVLKPSSGAVASVKSEDRETQSRDVDGSAISLYDHTRRTLCCRHLFTEHWDNPKYTTPTTDTTTSDAAVQVSGKATREVKSIPRKEVRTKFVSKRGHSDHQRKSDTSKDTKKRKSAVEASKNLIEKEYKDEDLDGVIFKPPPKRKCDKIPTKSKSEPVKDTKEVEKNIKLRVTVTQRNNRTYIRCHRKKRPSYEICFPVFVITTEDGIYIESDDPDDAWGIITGLVQRIRKSSHSSQVHGLAMWSITHDTVVHSIEQLPNANRLDEYSFHYSEHGPNRTHLHQTLPVPPGGCARTKPVIRKPYIDQFAFLNHPNRIIKLPSSDDSKQNPNSFDFYKRRTTSLADLPMAMRYRHIMKTVKEVLCVCPSTIHGRGLYCTQDIPVGEMIIEYNGTLIRPTLCDIRERYYDSKGIGSYMFRIDRHEVVDATMSGSMARFINHSCDPNCYSRIINVEGKKKIMIFAERTILKGEELTYDYKFPSEDNKIPCLCGSERCRRWMN